MQFSFSQSGTVENLRDELKQAVIKQASGMTHEEQKAIEALAHAVVRSCLDPKDDEYQTNLNVLRGGGDGAAALRKALKLAAGDNPAKPEASISISVSVYVS